MSRLLHGNVTIYDADGNPLPSAAGRLVVDPAEVAWPFSDRVGARQSHELTEGPTARPGWGAWLDVSASGYVSQRYRVKIPDGDDELRDEAGVPIVVKLQPIVTPIPPVDIRKWRGNFLGDFITPPFMYCGMPTSLRERVRASYLGTHLPVAVHNDYRVFPQWHYDFWLDLLTLRIRCVELKAVGIEPILVLHPKPGWSIEQHLAHVRVLWPFCEDLIRFVQWGWEINDLGGEWANGDRQLEYLAKLQQIVAPVPIGVHFTPERWAGWPSFNGTSPEKGETVWLKEAKKLGVTTLLYQEPWDKPEDEMIRRSFEVANDDSPSLGGIADRVVSCGLDFVLFEHSRNVARHDRLAVRALTFQTCSGYC